MFVNNFNAKKLSARDIELSEEYLKEEEELNEFVQHNGYLPGEISDEMLKINAQIFNAQEIA